MRKLLCLACLRTFGATAVFVRAQRADTPDEAARAAAAKLFQSLTEDQKKAVVQPVDSKDRYAEIFPVTKRPGLSFKQLIAEQKTQVDDMIKAMTSEYGASRCLEVAKQTGEDGRYLRGSTKTTFT